MKTKTFVKQLSDLERRAYAYKWGSFEKKSWNDWGLLFRFLVIICKLLIQNKITQKKKRAPSAWQSFLGEQMRKGKTIQESAILWKNNK